MGSVLWHIAGLFCHQLPDRSPQFEGAVFPLCFRCTGLYLSVITNFMFLTLNGGWRRRLPEMRCAISISFLIVPLLADGWANLTGLWSSPGWVRALTGIGVGLVLPVFLLPLAQRADRCSDAEAPMLSTPLALLPPAAMSLALLWLVVHPMHLVVFQVLAAVAACAPALFATIFALAGWRNRAAFSSALGIGPRRRSLLTS
jgi:uncharacterized membrane protein